LEETQGISEREAMMKKEGERLVAEGRDRGLHLRLLGAMAVQAHCPRYSFLTAKLGRVLSDIDFAAYGNERPNIAKMMRDFGYNDLRLVSLFSTGRMIWSHKSNGLHVDIFFDKLQMNHEIPFMNRLELDPLTISLADIILEKMQIVHMNEKDVVDTIMLLREHAVGDSAQETIDAPYIAKLLADDWGFYYTVTRNLSEVENRLPTYGQLSDEDRRDISGKIQTLLKIVEDEPKTVRWRLRSRVGTRSKWYTDVEDVTR
jgi:hypothetical protein